MAKQCIYCGRLLAKEDALICNECGRSQADPASGGAAGSSAIKVKLPPREFTRADPSPVRQETSLPGPAARATPLSSPQREQTALPPSRMPKRPARLSSSSEETLAPSPQAGAEEDAFSAVERLAGSVKPAAPTAAEEISTMVLPNWREELAQLRKEQEKLGTSFSRPSEKPAGKGEQDGPAVPRRPADPLPPHEMQSSLQGRSPEKTSSSDLTGSNRASQNAALAPELPRRTPSTPLPQDGARAPELPRRTPSRPLPRDVARPPELPRRSPSTPLSQENPPAGEPPRRELRVRVWEQEETIQYPQVQAEHQEAGLAAAVGQNPLASATFEGKEKDVAIEDLETVHWQTPLNPVPASSSQPPTPARQEQRAEVKKEPQPPVQQEQRVEAQRESRLPAREEQQSPVRAESQAVLAKTEPDIEDQPTMRLPVSEIAKQDPPLKIERASTPAPKKRATPPEDEVEDLPTRPMAASPATPRAPQQPAPQRPVEAALPPSPRPPAAPGGPSAGPLSPVPSQGQNAAMPGDALAARGRPAYPGAQPGPSFNPASLPPLPPGPISLAGNTQLRPEEVGMPGTQGGQGRPATPFPDPFSPRSVQSPTQRPPSFEPVTAPPVSMSPNVSIRDGAVGTEEKPRKKRRTGRVLVISLLLLLIVGGVIGVVVYNLQSGTQEYQTYQNSKFSVSLHYTPGWSVRVDQAHNTIHFGDNTNTDQVNLIMSAASGQVGDYLNQQATQLGVTGSKAASPLNFGGTSWQAVQGTVVQSGATFTIVLYAVQHGNHFYLLDFLAPQVSFQQAEHSHFEPLRASFNFV